MLINRVDLLKVILEVSSLPNAQKNIGFFSLHFFYKNGLFRIEWSCIALTMQASVICMIICLARACFHYLVLLHPVSKKQQSTYLIQWSNAQTFMEPCCRIPCFLLASRAFLSPTKIYTLPFVIFKPQNRLTVQLPV